MATVPTPPAPTRPLPPFVRRILASVWGEIEPRVDALFATLQGRLGKAYADLKVQVETYLGVK